MCLRSRLFSLCSATHSNWRHQLPRPVSPCPAVPDQKKFSSPFSTLSFGKGAFTVEFDSPESPPQRNISRPRKHPLQGQIESMEIQHNSDESNGTLLWKVWEFTPNLLYITSDKQNDFPSAAASTVERVIWPHWAGRMSITLPPCLATKPQFPLQIPPPWPMVVGKKGQTRFGEDKGDFKIIGNFLFL